MTIKSLKKIFIALFVMAVFASAGFIPIEGVFIQAWLYARWDDPNYWKDLNGDNPSPKITADNAWDLEAKYWKSMGVSQIIDGDIAYKNEGDPNWHASYPGHIKDSVEYGYNKDKDIIMEKAKKYGFKVYLGLGVDNGWWGWDLLKDEDFEKFKGAMMKAGVFARDIYNVYVNEKGYDSTFAGFYSVYEVWNHTHLNEGSAVRDEYARRLAEGFNILLDSLNKIAPNYPLLFSQFATDENSLDIHDTLWNDDGTIKEVGPKGFGTLENTELFWQKFFEIAKFRSQDKCLPMDAVGGGGQKINTVEAWTMAYENAIKNSKSKVGYYANIENFAQPLMPWHQEQTYTPLYGQNYISAGHVQRFARQIAIAQRHTKGIFNFAFSHYYSPLNAIPGYYNVLLNYLKTQEGDVVAPTLPKTLYVIDTIAYNESQSKLKGTSVHDEVFKFYWEGALSDKFKGALDDNGVHRVKINQPVLRVADGPREIVDSTVAIATATRSESGTLAHEPDSIYFPMSTGRECSGASGEEYCFLPRFHESEKHGGTLESWDNGEQAFFNDKFVFVVMDVWGNESVSKPFELRRTGVGTRYKIELELDSVRMLTLPQKDTLRSYFALDSTKWAQDVPEPKTESINPRANFTKNGMKVVRMGDSWKLQYNVASSGDYQLTIYTATGAKTFAKKIYLSREKGELLLPPNNTGYSRFFVQLIPISNKSAK